MADTYRRMEIKKACEQCGPAHEEKFIKTKCPDCDHSILLHCSSCEIQVTGCLCTAKERMTPEEFKNFTDQVKSMKKRKGDPRLRSL